MSLFDEKNRENILWYSVNYISYKTVDFTKFLWKYVNDAARP